MDENLDFESQQFEFPIQILNNISECSPDGFILFTVGEDGEVEMFKSPGTGVIETGLKTSALKILNALDIIENSEVAQSIIMQRELLDPPENEDNSDL